MVKQTRENTVNLQLVYWSSLRVLFGMCFSLLAWDIMIISAKQGVYKTYIPQHCFWLVTESFAHTLLVAYFCWNQVAVLWDSAMRIRKKVRSEEQPGHDVGWCRTTLLAVNSWLIPASAATARYMSTTWLVGNSIWKSWPTGCAEFFLHWQSMKEEGARYCLLVVYSDQSECFVIRGMQGWFQ